MYILRTDKGVMVAKISNEDAGKILRYAKGEWVEKKYVDGTKANGFVFSDDMTYGNDWGIVIYLWKDFYIHLKTD